MTLKTAILVDGRDVLYSNQIRTRPDPEIPDDSDDEDGYELTEEELKRNYVTEIIDQLYGKPLTIKSVETIMRVIAQSENYRDDKRIKKNIDYVINYPDTNERKIQFRETTGANRKLHITN